MLPNHGPSDPGLTQALTGFAAGRYLLVRQIGSGAEKDVYLVHDTVLDRDCALALLRSRGASDDSAVRFRTEARAIASLGSHPHIVTVFDMGVHEDRLFIVAEHMAGGDLAGMLRDAGGKLPVATSTDIGRQLVRGLAAAHEHGIIHGDVKPPNVWLTSEGVVKLGDFGVAQLAARPVLTGDIVGTPAYMAPEHLRGEIRDGRADFYALGCLMFELLTGAPPFGGTVEQMISAHLSAPPPPLTGAADFGRIEPVVRALLAKNRDDRPATAADVLRMLDDSQSRVQTSGVTTGMPAWRASFEEALGRRDVAGAVQVLQQTLAAGPDPEARLALGNLLLVVDPVVSRQALELAGQEFMAAGLNARAAVAAAAVAASYASGEGNRVAAKPWLQRAWRLIRDEGPCVERGWVAIRDISCNTDDSQVLHENCDIALEMARRFHDVELEAKALADGGCALTQLGEIAEGTARMDEGLVLTTSGQCKDPVILAENLCAFFTSLAVTGDLARYQAWNRVFRQRGLVGDGAHAITTTHCDSVYGGLLCRLGRFNEAESTLTRAVDDARETIYAGRLHPLSNLAELRIQQGRLSEAEDLLRGHEDFIETLLPRAKLYCARKDFGQAAATARRALRLVEGDRTRAVSLLCLLVEAELGRENIGAAQAACRLLDERVAGTSLPALAAEANYVRAQLLLATGDRLGAVSELERAVDGSAPLQIGPLSAKLHLALARLHAGVDPSAALVEANTAAAILARLDVTMSPDDREFLSAVGALPVPAPGDGGR